MPYPVVVTIIIKLKRTFPQGSYSVFSSYPNPG